MRRSLAVFTLALFAPSVCLAQRVRTDSTFLSGFSWRSVGPANMGGRISDIEANPQNPKVIYVAAATGGIWKTVNAGTTWTPVFDRYPCHSVSELAIAPSDTSIVWAGTGEEDSPNSISPGCGVFKSTDAGRTWTYVGLRETQSIGRIVIDPQDPNVVYVAAIGHPWGPNPDRGLYKTTDGGQNWNASTSSATARASWTSRWTPRITTGSGRARGSGHARRTRCGAAGQAPASGSPPTPVRRGAG